MDDEAPSACSEKWIHKNGTFLLSVSATPVVPVTSADFSEKKIWSLLLFTFLNRLTLRNELDHLIFPVHCKSTLPRKFLPELLAIILAWTQGILEVELKAWIWFKYFPSHTSPCPQSLVTVTQFKNYAFELHAQSHHLQSGLHFSQSIWWTISYFPKVSPGTYLLFLSSIDSLCTDSKTIGL